MGHTLREVMGGYPTGVTIVAACEEGGEPYGLTVNSFTSVSLDPPLVSVCVGHSSTSHDRLVASPGFSVNILAGDQFDVAMRFAREPSEGRFDEVEWERSTLGSPILDGSLGWLDCSVERVITIGDHSVLLGRVEHAASTDRPALLFHRGRMSSSE